MRGQEKQNSQFVRSHLDEQRSKGTARRRGIRVVVFFVRTTSPWAFPDVSRRIYESRENPKLQRKIRAHRESIGTRYIWQSVA